MVWPLVAAAVIAGVGAISDIIGGRKAAKAAKKQGALEKSLEAAVTQEKLRQMRVEEKVMRGETIAQVAGSGVKVGQGSPLMVLAEQAREFSMQREATMRTGATKMAAIGQRAGAIASQAKWGSYSAAANQFSSMFSLYGASKG